MAFPEIPKTLFHRIRVRGEKENTPARRLRWQGVAEGIDIHPGGLSPSAILIVRQIGVTVTAAAAERRYFPMPSQERMQAQLQEALRRAARPRQGFLPSNAPAVVFGDMGELLACLALDTAAGTVPRGWWWQPLLRKQSLPGWTQLLQACQENIRFVPAMFYYLQCWQKIPEVINHLPVSATQPLLMSLATEFELIELKSLLREAFQPREFVSPQQSPGRTDFVKRYLPDGPFSRLAPAAKSALAAVSLLLYHAPQRLRQAEVLKDFIHWIISDRENAATENNPTMKEENIRSERSKHVMPPAAGEPELGIVFPKENTAPFQTGSKNFHPVPAKSPNGDSSAPLENEDPAKKPENALAPWRGSRQYHIPSINIPETGQETETAESITVVDQLLAAGNGVFTELAGILFLIPLFQSLRLLPEGQPAFKVMQQLNGWEWLELFGRALLGKISPQSAADPLWRILAKLDGREDMEAPGGGFRGDREYILPKEWFAFAMPEKCFYRETRRGLTVCYPGDPGFLMADFTGKAESTAGRLGRLKEAWGLADKTEMRRVSAPFSFPGSGFRSGNAALDRFIRFVAAYLSWRLYAVFPEAQKSPKEAVCYVLQRKGQLFVSATHVDLILPLDSADVDIRCAGLDFNPGWVPSLRRVVTFYYR